MGMLPGIYSWFISIILQQTNCKVLNQIGRVYIPDIGYPGAENIAMAPYANRLFAADGYSIALNVISFEFPEDINMKNVDDANMHFEQAIYFESILDQFEGNLTVFDVTSTTYSPHDYIIANIVPNDYAINHGYAVFIDPYNLTIFNLIELPNCYLPDHVTTALNGNIIVISCEGEANDNTIQFPEFNPPGSVSLIDVQSSNWSVINIGFEEFDENGIKHHLLPDDIYLPYLDQPFSINAEPEYATCNNIYCFICLQEQNAIAVLDLQLKTFISVHTLGTTNYNQFAALDASDRDNSINIVHYPNLYGLRMPDAIDYFESKNDRYFIFTANEGDSKDFDESRVGSMTLNIDAFMDVNISELQLNTNLGRLKVSNLLGTINGSEYSELYTFSSRDFTIFEVKINDNDQIPDISFVYSSGDDFERITADILGYDAFNCNDYVPSFDTRSDDKGPEPESIATGTCSNGQSYVFIGMERVGGIFVYDITELDDAKIEYIEYINNRNFSIEYLQNTRAPEDAGDVGPEQIKFINDSYFGVPLLIVANAESSSVTMYRIDCEIKKKKDDKKLSTNEIIGIIIGVIVIFTLITVFLYHCYRKKGNKKTIKNLTNMTKLKSNKTTGYNTLDK